MVRTTGNPSLVTASIRAAVPAVAPRNSATNLRPMRDVLTDAVAEPRLTMLITGSFGLLALALAAVGIYGVISYTVAQRTREIGIRRALGARVGDVLQLVVGEGLLLGAIGVALGLAGAVVLMQWTSSLLFGVTARDPITYASVGGILLFTAALASWIPARRAIRVEPVTALREESVDETSSRVKSVMPRASAAHNREHQHAVPHDASATACGHSSSSPIPFRKIPRTMTRK